MAHNALLDDVDGRTGCTGSGVPVLMLVRGVLNRT